MTLVNLQAEAGKPKWFSVPINYQDLQTFEPQGAARIATLPKRCAIRAAIYESIEAFGGAGVSYEAIIITDDLLNTIINTLTLDTGGSVFLTVTSPVSFSADRIIYANPSISGQFASMDRGSGVLHLLVEAIPSYPS